MVVLTRSRWSRGRWSVARQGEQVVRLFHRITDIPVFTGGSYVSYLAPGVVVMTALMSAGWNGMSFIDATTWNGA